MQKTQPLWHVMRPRSEKMIEKTPSEKDVAPYDAQWIQLVLRWLAGIAWYSMVFHGILYGWKHPNPEMEKAYKIAQMNISAQKIAQKVRILRHISIRVNTA